MILSKKNLAIAMVMKYVGIERKKIAKCQQIHLGFTNQSFKITTIEGKSYQVRFGGRSSKIVSRVNEFRVLKALNVKGIIYFDQATGNLVKEWVEGNNVKHWTDSLLRQLALRLKEIHQKPIDLKIIKFDPLAYMGSARNLSKQINDDYLDLVKKFENDKNVICHNDCNGDNLVLDNKGIIHLIDFEWSRLNSPYWDLANFAREEELNNYQIGVLANSYSIKMSFNKLRAYIFLATCFAYQWTYIMPRSLKILRYRKKVKKLLALNYKEYLKIRGDI